MYHSGLGMNRLLFSALSVAAILAASACDSNESTKEGDAHDPARVVLSVNGTAMTGDTLFLPFGQTVTVRATFFTAADGNLDDQETEHWSRLTFDPAAAVDVDHHYSHQVTVNGTAEAKGMVDIGYGHDELADEHTLHAPVRITP
jgi:hypothetical protein